MTIDELILTLVERNGSDLHIKSGRPPLFRIAGRLVPTEFPKLGAAESKSLLYSILKPSQVERLEQEQELDCAYEVKSYRVRVNMFYSRGNVCAVCRLIHTEVPSLDKLDLPPVIKDIAGKKQGMILVTGPTGSGKSTTLAAILNYINSTLPGHIITIEDPIEFVLKDNMCSINQRETGLDTKSFYEALRHALREDPNVIMIGEMRDMETVKTAMAAAETGHLVLSTLHTNDAKQSIDRILDTFPAEQQRQIRFQLSNVLLAVLSQRLLRRKNGAGRVAVLEILIASPTIQKLIQDGDIGAIGQAMEESVTYYRMQTFNQALLTLCKSNVVSLEDALSVSPKPDELKMTLKGIHMRMQQ